MENIKKFLIYVFLLLVSVNIINAALIDNITTYYKMDNSTFILDELNQRNGTNSGATYTADGKINGAYEYDGTSSYIDLPEDFDIFNGTEEFTVNSWINRSGPGTNDWLITDFRGENTFLISEDATGATTGASGGVYIYYREDGNDRFVNYGTDTANNVWAMVTVTYEPGVGMILYINGTQVANNTNTGTFAGPTASHFNTIGADGNRDQFFNGTIDEVGIWNDAKSPTEVSDLYNSHAGFPYPFVVPENATINITNITANGVVFVNESYINTSPVNFTLTITNTSTNDNINTSYSLDTYINYDNLSNVNYNNRNFSVASQDTSPTGTFFKSDGTKMYVVGQQNDYVHQYSLSEAWNVSTASYDSINFSISSEDSNPFELFFKDDGTKMYMVGDQNNKVFEYDLGTAWDLSTASYNNINFSVASQETTPVGLFFKGDGTKMFVVGIQKNVIYQYGLSEAWNLSTASYDNTNFSVASEESTSTGLFFNGNGTKIYLIGQTNSDIYQYGLTDAWNLSTASYDNVNVDTTAQDNSPTALVFKDDGSKIYITGDQNNKVFEYDVTGIELDSPLVQFGTNNLNPSVLLDIDDQLNHTIYFYSWNDETNFTSQRYTFYYNVTSTCIPPDTGNWTINSSENCIINNSAITLEAGYIYYFGDGNITFINSTVVAAGFERNSTFGGTDTQIYFYSSNTTLVK